MKNRNKNRKKVIRGLRRGLKYTTIDFMASDKYQLTINNGYLELKQDYAGVIGAGNLERAYYWLDNAKRN